MSEMGTATRPLRVAIVGSGPAGFYAAEALFKSGQTVQVDMYDRLPTPYGLVRGGVAPDHQKIKNVIRVYDRIARTAGFTFFGNITVGRDLTVDELRRHYDAVILSTGAETDRRLSIPGEDLPGSHTATEFVGWYNGHPDYRDRTFDLSGEVAVVIGQGNVAMDVSRILAKTVDELADSDIADYALDALAESKIKEIHVIGRRGPAQTKFTPPEIKEIAELADCDPIVNPADLALNPASLAELEQPDSKHQRKNFEVLQAMAARAPAGKSRRYILDFLLSPVELRGNGRVEEVVLEENELQGEPAQQWAKKTGVQRVLACDIFFRSVGYRGVPVPGVPFDDKRGLIPSQDGRVMEGDEIIPGLYVAGWIKRGPSGIIGTNKPCSQGTVATLLADLPALPPCPHPDTGAIKELLAARGVRAITFQDWEKIDAAEVARGKARNKPREKFAVVDEMLTALD